MKDKLAGKAEELMGKMTGDKAAELRGKARQQAGNAKQTGKEIAHDAEHGHHPETEAQPEDDEPIR